MNKKILVIPGDGIGAEVTTWGKAVLEQIAKTYGHTFTYDDALMGHEVIEATGSPLPDETLAKAKASDAMGFVCCWYSFLPCFQGQNQLTFL